ncbi:DsbA family protein [Streptomyces macrosporus]|uniref:Thioredoxin-like fold domain-containing protein n=1 Tax=Streptomyces macrosporus TaxID=44032 RepID=A0ABN3JYY2_9ACTN
MTNRNTPEGKHTARERLRRRREREKKAEKRARTLKTVIAAVAVLGVVGLVGAVAAHRGGGEAGAGGTGAGVEPIVDGDPGAPVTLTVYEDFRCPGCGHFENGFREAIHRLRDGGKMKVEYHLVTIIDGNVGGHGSAYAANAAACARDEGRFREYHDVLFAHQPEEIDDAFADKDRLLELAKQVKGLSGPDFTRCVREDEHREWVERSNEAFLASGHDSTPTVLLDGEDLYGDPSAPLTPEKLTEKVEAAARKA